MKIAYSLLIVLPMFFTSFCVAQKIEKNDACGKSTCKCTYPRPIIYPKDKATKTCIPVTVCKKERFIEASDCCEEPMTPYDQGQRICPDEMIGGYNAPAEIENRCSWNFFITGSFLYYQVKQMGMNTGLKAENILDNPFKLHTLKTDIDWKPGFKLGLGYKFKYDNWDIYIEYISLHVKHLSKDTFKLDIQRFDSDWDNVTGLVRTQHVKTKWIADIDLIDALLGRACYIGTSLTFNPYFGIRFGVLDQKYKQKYFVPTSSSSSLDNYPNPTTKSDSWLVGPKVGLSTNWLLCKGFRLFNNIATSLLYQKFDINYKINIVSSISPISILENKVTHHDDTIISPNVMITLGCGWNSYFAGNKYNLDFSAGYSFEIFFNQNFMRFLKDEYAGSDVGGEACNLIMNGLVLTTRLDF